MIFICRSLWKTSKCQGKIREKSGNFEVDDKWQPCNRMPLTSVFMGQYIMTSKWCKDESNIDGQHISMAKYCFACDVDSGKERVL